MHISEHKHKVYYNKILLIKNSIHQCVYFVDNIADLVENSLSSPFFGGSRLLLSWLFLRLSLLNFSLNVKSQLFSTHIVCIKWSFIRYKYFFLVLPFIISFSLNAKFFAFFQPHKLQYA